MFTIRVLDYTFTILGLIVLAPLMLIVIVIIKLTSEGPVFYRQERVGKNGRLFRLFKFRTMRMGADKSGLLTIGGKDNRVTSIGYYLRKYKLDELPQLINVLRGEMSLVGPRPEVPKYVALYNEHQRKVLQVRPGITDLASIFYRNESELLASASNPEAFYIEQLMPHKIELNSIFMNKPGLRSYFQIILKTLIVSIKGK